MIKTLRFLIFLFLLNTGSQTVFAQVTNLNTPPGSGQFGNSVTVLLNGNYVVTDPYWDQDGIADVGAVYLYDGKTHALISILTGSLPNDNVGLGGVTALSNGHFLVRSYLWNNESTEDVGAVTWGSGVTGMNGVVNSNNSLVGSTKYDRVGNGGVVELTNGNFVVMSSSWQNTSLSQSGAITWGNGHTGIVGIVSSANSLVSNPARDLGINQIASIEITTLPSGNYLVGAPYWNNGAASRAGALTWGDGNTRISGEIGSSNSLVGSSPGDNVGVNIRILTNGNYVHWNALWDNGTKMDAGAVTWGDGNIGVHGLINNVNSLVGSSAFDKVGGTLTVLTNGNYVVGSDTWRNGSIAGAGAVTFGNGTTGLTGEISENNSLVGTKVLDQVGSSSWYGGIIALANGNYLVSTPTWDNGKIVDAGAVTWGSGTTGVVGKVNETNSLIGVSKDDQLGKHPYSNIAVLSDGNYVVINNLWDNGSIVNVGAVTWADGNIGAKGFIDNTNSLIGSKAEDQLGAGGITILSNGNYVIGSPSYDDGDILDAGAATWCPAAYGIVGTIDRDNSLIGSSENDQVGARNAVTALTNGHYVVRSYLWDNGSIVDAGAITWGHGEFGKTGFISELNSFVGSKKDDQVGFSIIRVLPGGNYLAISYNWDNGTVVDAGAVTWGDGNSGDFGPITSSNSLIGVNNGDQVGFGGVTILANGNYLIRSSRWDNGTEVNAGAITWGNQLGGLAGYVNASNSLIGTMANNPIGGGGIKAMTNGNFYILSPGTDYGDIKNAGAVTWGNGMRNTAGTISVCNSAPGTINNFEIKVVENTVHNYLIVGRGILNSVAIFDPTGVDLAGNDDVSADVSEGEVTPLLVGSGCQIIANLESSGANPVSGQVEAKLWVESNVPSFEGKPYVARHYQLTPESNASTATGRVTLYFTKQEFEDFNDHPDSATDLPKNGSDVSGKSNLIITKYSGTSNDNSGTPESYDPLNGITVIDPADNDIIWNPNFSRWEISFAVTGFSGFFVQTKSQSLPVQLVSFEGKAQEKSAVLNWEISNAHHFSHFEIERSVDGKHFNFVQKIDFFNDKNYYESVDYEGYKDLIVNNELYYRLKMIDQDGTFAHSRLITLEFEKSIFLHDNYLFFNPASNVISITLENRNGETVMVNLKDNQGSAILNGLFKVENDKISLDVSNIKISPGLHIISVITKNKVFNVKLVKE